MLSKSRRATDAGWPELAANCPETRQVNNDDVERLQVTVILLPVLDPFCHPLQVYHIPNSQAQRDIHQLYHNMQENKSPQPLQILLGIWELACSRLCLRKGLWHGYLMWVCGLPMWRCYVTGRMSDIVTVWNICTRAELSLCPLQPYLSIGVVQIGYKEE